MTTPEPKVPRTGPVRVFLVDDHALFRTGVRAELDSAGQVAGQAAGREAGQGAGQVAGQAAGRVAGREGGGPEGGGPEGGAAQRVTVIGEAGSVNEAVAGIVHLKPDVVLLDVHMPDGGGAEVLRRTRVDQPDVVFLALSVSDAAEDVIAVIRAGARGYVTKTISGRDLVAAVCRVADGDAVFSPRLAGFVLDAFADRPGAAPISDPELDLLTPRERDVLRLLARGYAYKEIASELFISIKTVETHVSSVLRKTQLSNRYELSRWAADRRLV